MQKPSKPANTPQKNENRAGSKHRCLLRPQNQGETCKILISKKNDAIKAVFWLNTLQFKRFGQNRSNSDQKSSKTIIFGQNGLGMVNFSKKNPKKPPKCKFCRNGQNWPKSVREVFAKCSRSVREVFAKCSRSVREVFAKCSRSVREVFAKCSRSVREVFARAAGGPN